jgi:hypothetical protein
MSSIREGKSYREYHSNTSKRPSRSTLYSKRQREAQILEQNAKKANNSKVPQRQEPIEIDQPAQNDINQNAPSDDNTLDFSFDEDNFDSIIQSCTEVEEVAAAFLNSFYCGKMTQDALAMQLQLINAAFDKELPKDFDGLRKIIVNESNIKKQYSKTWFCQTCRQEVLITSKCQRLCDTCKTRCVSLFYRLYQR